MILVDKNIIIDMINNEDNPHWDLLTQEDCSIENIFLAATAEGYACTLRIPLGNEDEYAKQVLNFPDDYFMPCFIGVGKPKADATIIKQQDINTKDRIHWNKW